MEKDRGRAANSAHAEQTERTAHAEETRRQRKDITRDIILRTLLLGGAIFVVYGLLYLFFGDSLRAAGGWLGEHLGLWGVGIYCLLVDMFIVPTTVDVIFPFTMVWNPVPLLLVMSSASALGGYGGYWIARSLNHWRVVNRVTSRYRAKWEHILQHYGAWGIALAGFTPIPFSTISWTAGLLKVPWGWAAIACLSRFPRMAVYYLLIRAGISLISVPSM